MLRFSPVFFLGAIQSRSISSSTTASHRAKPRAASTHRHQRNGTRRRNGAGQHNGGIQKTQPARRASRPPREDYKTARPVKEFLTFTCHLRMETQDAEEEDNAYARDDKNDGCVFSDDDDDGSELGLPAENGGRDKSVFAMDGLQRGVRDGVVEPRVAGEGDQPGSHTVLGDEVAGSVAGNRSRDADSRASVAGAPSYDPMLAAAHRDPSGSNLYESLDVFDVPQGLFGVDGFSGEAEQPPSQSWYPLEMMSDGDFEFDLGEQLTSKETLSPFNDTAVGNRGREDVDMEDHTTIDSASQSTDCSESPEESVEGGSIEEESDTDQSRPSPTTFQHARGRRTLQPIDEDEDEDRSESESESEVSASPATTCHSPTNEDDDGQMRSLIDAGLQSTFYDWNKDSLEDDLNASLAKAKIGNTSTTKEQGQKD